MIVLNDAIAFFSDGKKEAARVTELILQKSGGLDHPMGMLIQVYKKIGFEKFEEFCARTPAGHALIPFANAALSAES